MKILMFPIEVGDDLYTIIANVSDTSKDEFTVMEEPLERAPEMHSKERPELLKYVEGIAPEALESLNEWLQDLDIEREEFTSNSLPELDHED